MKPALVRSSIRIAVATVAMVPVGLLTASSASASAATFDGYGPTAYGGYYWSPSSATINSGQSVSWANASGTHGLKTLSGPWPSSCQSAPDPVTCTLTSPGTYNFECYYHLSAMTGSVTVNAPL